MEQSALIESIKHRKKLTRFGKDHFESSRFRSILGDGNPANIIVSAIGSDCLIPDTESAVRIGRVRGILAFGSNFEDDVVALDLIPHTHVLNKSRASLTRDEKPSAHKNTPLRHRNPFEWLFSDTQLQRIGSTRREQRRLLSLLTFWEWFQS